MRHSLSALLLAILCCCLPGAHAQTLPAPPLLNFQGRLTKPDGTPVQDGTYSLRFSLWDAATGGTEKWNQTFGSISVKNGAFAALLNVAAPANLFDGSLWLEIKVGNNPALTPRQQLVTVAYALKANIVPDGSITNAKVATGTLTADRLAPNALNALTWLLAGNSITDPATQFLGTTSNQPLVFRANNAEKMRLLANGNLGIGTASPGYTLDVAGTVHGRKDDSIGVYGQSDTYLGVLGTSNTNYGVTGTSTSGGGVQGVSTSNYGVVGFSTSSGGVYGESSRGNGIIGHTSDANSYGVSGNGPNYGVLGVSTSSGNTGILGGPGYGVYGNAPVNGNYGGYFSNTGGGIALKVAGRAEVGNLRVVGGSDVAEPYQVAPAGKIHPLPGMIVSIDPVHVGQMKVASKPYDRSVGGILSGANGIQPGLTLTQSGTLADGKLPVASVGRVWCWCDADANGAIAPGDLLTSSRTPGHAMKVTDFNRANGAVIGKAMSSLKRGKGLVLVLVSLK